MTRSNLCNILTYFRPCIGDFSIHGSIYAHLLRDPIPGKVTQTKAPMVASWCERMAGHVFESKHLDFWDVENGQLVKIRFTKINYALKPAIKLGCLFSLVISPEFRM